MASPYPQLVPRIMGRIIAPRLDILSYAWSFLTSDRAGILWICWLILSMSSLPMSFGGTTTGPRWLSQQIFSQLGREVLNLVAPITSMQQNSPRRRS